MTKTNETLVFISSGLQSPELEILLSKIQICINNNEYVYVAICSGAKSYACSFNVWGSSLICKKCKARTKNGLNLIKGSYTLIETPLAIKNINFTLSSKEKLKGFYYKKSDIGKSVYGSYLGITRDLNLEGYIAENSIKKLISTAIAIQKWIDLFLDKHEFISQVYLYSGRNSIYRQVLRAAENKGINYRVLEFAGQDSNCVYEFENSMAQDLNNTYKAIEEKWENEKNYEIKKEYANKFYNLKRKGMAVNDPNVYTKSQKKNTLPKSWSTASFNVVIFNSSEDEFAALGGEYDNTIFDSQLNALKFIFNALNNKKKIRVWLKIHPNLKNVLWEFNASLKRLCDKYSHVEFVPGSSYVSSYTMLNASDAVISFGSTMGIEAAYWNKPSILIGRMVYEKYNSTYQPKSILELSKLLNNIENLQPGSREGALKYGYFWTNGGKSIPYFTGSRESGFKFNGIMIRIGYFDQISYLFGKVFESFFMQRFLNVFFRSKQP